MQVDSDKSGQIDFSEFLSIAMELFPHYSQNQARIERNVAVKSSSRRSDRISRRRVSIIEISGLERLRAEHAAAALAPIAQQSDDASSVSASQSPSVSRMRFGNQSSLGSLGNSLVSGPCMDSVADEDRVSSDASVSASESTSPAMSLKVKPAPSSSLSNFDRSSKYAIGEGDGTIPEVQSEDGGEEDGGEEDEFSYSCESTFARDEGTPGVDYLWLK
jgi:hypothetical protein